MTRRREASAAMTIFASVTPQNSRKIHREIPSAFILPYFVCSRIVNVRMIAMKAKVVCNVYIV